MVEGGRYRIKCTTRSTRRFTRLHVNSRVCKKIKRVVRISLSLNAVLYRSRSQSQSMLWMYNTSSLGSTKYNTTTVLEVGMTNVMILILKLPTALGYRPSTILFAEPFLPTLVFLVEEEAETLVRQPAESVGWDVCCDTSAHAPCESLCTLPFCDDLECLHHARGVSNCLI